MSRRFTRKADEPDPAGRREGKALSDEELAGEVGELLPDRAALSTLDADVAIPLSPALAAEILAGEAQGEDEGEQGPGDDEPSS